MKNEKIKLLFEKIKKAHDIYARCSNEKKIAILEAFGKVFDELESMGVPKAFSESLLIFGKEFVDSFTTSTEPDSTLPTEPSRPATIEDAEAIFGAKAVDLTPKEQREFDLASKYNALVYRPLPAKGDHVKIEVLVQNKLPLDTQT